MTRTAQVSDEINAFKVFITASKEPIDPSSVLIKSPSAPDIECKYLSGCGLAFELVELLDPGFKRIFEVQQSKVHSLYDHLDKMAQADREPFVSQYGNSDILVNFHDNCSLGSIKAAIPDVFRELLTLPAGFDGLTDTFTVGSLKKTVKSISISRGGFQGPLFNGQAMGWVGDPCVGTVQNKLNKSYVTPHPIELIAYIDGNPMFPDNVWKPTLDNFLRQLPSLSPFRRIWVVDLGKQAIAYAHPMERKLVI
ncbi:MAG TPA: hypothetical protein VFX56_06805 [Nitrospira sp.]|nr:hypothetical protein [Nitrospira sp.]